MKKSFLAILMVTLLAVLAGCGERREPTQPTQEEEISEESTEQSEPEPEATVSYSDIQLGEDDTSTESVFRQYEDAVDAMRYVDSVDFEIQVDTSLTSSGGMYLGEASYLWEGEYLRLPLEEFGFDFQISSTGGMPHEARYFLTEGVLYQELEVEAVSETQSPVSEEEQEEEETPTTTLEKERRQQNEEELLKLKEELDGLTVGFPLPYYPEELTLEQITSAEVAKEVTQGGYRITLYFTQQPLSTIGSLSRFVPLGTMDMYLVAGDGSELEDLLSTTAQETGEETEEDLEEVEDTPTYEGILTVDIDKDGRIEAYHIQAETVVEFPSGNTPTLSVDATYTVRTFDEVKPFAPPANEEDYEDFTIYEETE